MYNISAEAGFATESSFFRAFKAQTGMTPTEWREQQPHSNNEAT